MGLFNVCKTLEGRRFNSKLRSKKVGAVYLSSKFILTAAKVIFCDATTSSDEEGGGRVSQVGPRRQASIFFECMVLRGGRPVPCDCMPLSSRPMLVV